MASLSTFPRTEVALPIYSEANDPTDSAAMIGLEALGSNPEPPQDLAAELALLTTEQELEAAATALAPQLSGCANGEVPEELVARERSFFAKIFSNTLDMASRQPGPVVLLFDVDWTIVHNDRALARPAFALAIRELDKILGDRLQVGLLTTRPKAGKIGESLDSELEHPTYTAGVDHKLNPDFLISSGDLERANQSAVLNFARGTDTAAQIAAAKDVLDPQLIAPMSQPGMTTRKFYDTKLMILQQLVAQYPDRAFVVVDDLPLADAIKQNDDHVRGVRVNQEILDGSLRPYNQLASRPKILA